ncbi:hypothetical protein B0H21DRAFT_438711 [Amylocystis lapponica]|nr:hypothetical protein B0H21DRAFT_438711 [Amylocystis lapponica]
MTSIFASNRLLPTLKRRPRSKPDTSKAKAKRLDILPNVSEEDEARHSSSSMSSFDSMPAYGRSRSAGGNATLGNRLSDAERKRDSRRVVLTGAEGLTFEDFFPVSSTPPRLTPPPLVFKSSPSSESPLDDINLRFSGLGISLDFPSPPNSPPQQREHSPAPSMSSSHTATSRSSASSIPSDSSSKQADLTPPTSDDESHPPRLHRAPTCKSQRASILFMKSMPDLTQRPAIVEVDEDIDEDAEWFARDISDVITLSTPLPPSFPSSMVPPSPATDAPARPESMIAPRRRQSKPLPNLPRISVVGHTSQGRPSAQLDPGFPPRRKSFLIPDRPPPPPPIKIERCSTMEQETDNLLAHLASAALGSGFLGTGLSAIYDGNSAAGSLPTTPSSAYLVHSRPLPRMSIPADIMDLSDEVPYTPGLENVLEVEIAPESDLGHDQAWPVTPNSISIYSQESIGGDSLPVTPISPFDFDFDTSPITPHAGPASPDSPIFHMARESMPERNLRSRWSSSTLGSMADRQQHSTSSWMPRFHLSPTKKGKGKAAAPRTPPPKPSPPMSPALKRSFELEMHLERRNSSSSRLSSDSGESTTSAGLRRKPIPVEIFMR